MTGSLLRPFHDQRIPVIGFVNEGRRSTSVPKAFVRSSTSGSTPAPISAIIPTPISTSTTCRSTEYTADILGASQSSARPSSPRQDAPVLPPSVLFTGPTRGNQEGPAGVPGPHGYRVAPVTLDNSDYQYAALYTRPEYRERVRQEYVPYMESVVAFFEARSIEVVGREFPQILLLHANELNADLVPDLLAMFRRRGYTFVTLDRALADDAYRLPDEYVGRGGFSWIHRWSKTKGMKPKGEPDPPAWVSEAWAAR